MSWIKTVIFKNETETEISVPISSLSLQPLTNGGTALCYQLNGQPVVLVQFGISLATEAELTARKVAADSAQEAKNQTAVGSKEFQ